MLSMGLNRWRELMTPSGKYGKLLRSRPLAHLIKGSDVASGCSMLLIHAGAFTWMLDAVKKTSRSDEGLSAETYIRLWNEAVHLGLETCIGRSCPSRDAVGSSLSGESHGQL